MGGGLGATSGSVAIKLNGWSREERGRELNLADLTEAKEREEECSLRDLNLSSAAARLVF